MKLPPWRSPLAHALHRNRSLPTVRFLQLATVDHKGRPRNRTVVFRGFHPATHQLQLITNHRSEKISQLQLNPWAELCWYFPKSRDQFRLSGTMDLKLDHTDQVEDQDLRCQIWQQLSDNSKQQFYWPAPGQPRSPEQAEPRQVLPYDPPESFCVLLLTVVGVDHLRLKGHPHDRHRYDFIDGQWTVQAINA